MENDPSADREQQIKELLERAEKSRAELERLKAEHAEERARNHRRDRFKAWLLPLLFVAVIFALIQFGDHMGDGSPKARELGSYEEPGDDYRTRAVR